MSPQRIQMSRQHPWRDQHPDAVIVDRRTRWGNPYRVSGALSAYTAVCLFREFIERCSRDLVDPVLRHDGLGVWDRDIKATIRRELAGRDLACWCPLDEPCHADVLLELANGGAS